MKTFLQTAIASVFAPWLFLILCWITVFSLSCKLAAASVQNTVPDGSEFGQQVLRGAGEALSVALAEKADVYFHRGVPRKRKKAFKDRFFQKIASTMAPDGHAHLEGNLIKETLPWYWLAVQMDPHNIQNYLIASYWISASLDNKPLAHEILMQARRNTHLHYEIEMEDAIIYLKEYKILEAEKAIDVALRIWPSGEDSCGENAQIGMLNLLILKSLLREVNNDKEGAVRCLRQVLKITPDDADIKQRLEDLETGKEPSEKAALILDGMINRTTKATTCHWEDGEHEHEDHHDHEDNHVH